MTTSQQRAEEILQTFRDIKEQSNPKRGMEEVLIEALDQSRKEGFNEAVEKCAAVVDNWQARHMTRQLNVELTDVSDVIRNLKAKP